MDEVTLEGLLAALVVSPDNTALRLAVIGGLYRAGDPRAAEHVGDLQPGALSADHRALVAGVLLRAGRPAHALAFTTGSEPALQLLRARALHAQGDQPAALTAYEAAVRGNPT